MRKIISSCIYCGCGCKLEYWVENNKIIKIRGWEKDDISEGKPCIKGLTINEIFDKNRIPFPLKRTEKGFKRISWKEGISILKEIIKENECEDFFINGSGKITNEENYAILKFGKGLLKTKNIDSCCGRLCHISTVKGLQDCFGYPNLTSLQNLEKIDTLFIIGSNPAVNYPVFWNKVLKRKDKIKIISVQSLLNLTSEFGDIFLEIEPGTEIALLNGICNYILKKSKFSKKVKEYPNFKSLEEKVSKYTPKYVSKICKIKQSLFLEACEEIANSRKLGVFHGMGFTQHTNSLGNLYSLLNLVLLKDAFILTLRGEINVQGVGDIFSIDENKLEKKWNLKIAKGEGKHIIEALLLNPVKVAFIVEFNPAHSLPCLNEVHKNLENLTLVYFGAYWNLTCEFANLILPIPALFESQGTITQGEQRIRFVKRVLKPYKEAKELWKIFKEVCKGEGKNLFNYRSEKDIFREIVEVSDLYKNLDVESIYKGKDGFPKKRIKHRIFHPTEFKGKDEYRTKEFPFLLTTFREKHQFLTSEITSFSKTLSMLDKDKGCIFINPEDAKELKLKEDEEVKIVSEVGEVKAKIKFSERLPRKLLATRFHHKELLVNKLFPREFDPSTFTPNYKCCAVRIEKIKK